VEDGGGAELLGFCAVSRFADEQAELGIGHRVLVDPEPGEAYLVDGRLPVGSVALAERVTHKEFAGRHRAVGVQGCMFGGGRGSGRHGALAALGVRALMSVRSRMAAGAAVAVTVRPGRHCRLPIASSRISAASSQARSARTM
jgi:hypothetical protein